MVNRLREIVNKNRQEKKQIPTNRRSTSDVFIIVIVIVGIGSDSRWCITLYVSNNSGFSVLVYGLVYRGEESAVDESSGTREILWLWPFTWAYCNYRLYFWNNDNRTNADSYLSVVSGAYTWFAFGRSRRPAMYEVSMRPQFVCMFP